MSVDEDSGLVEVCAEVKSGEIDANVDVRFSLSVSPGTAGLMTTNVGLEFQHHPIHTFL